MTIIIIIYKKFIIYIASPNVIIKGRFDQLIYIPMPDLTTREEILKAALRKVPLEDSLDLQYLANHTHGFSGADLKEICQRVLFFNLFNHQIQILTSKNNPGLQVCDTRKY